MLNLKNPGEKVLKNGGKVIQMWRPFRLHTEDPRSRFPNAGFPVSFPLKLCLEIIFLDVLLDFST